MSEIDKQQIDRLYELMEREKGDQDMTAALRWAIFQLEQMGREIIKGYLVTAMQATGAEHDSIQAATDALDAIFDDTDAATARKAYREL